MNLIEMKSGTSAVIEKLPEGEVEQRLEALGLHTGKEIEKVSCMPFGGPVTVMLEGRHFAVSHGIAEQIELTGAEAEETA